MSRETNMQKREAAAAERLQARRSAPPPVDIYENENEVLVVADLPGVRKEDLAVHFEKGQLTVEGRRDPAAAGTLLAGEFEPLDYKRVFSVSHGIDADRITAEMIQGVLRVHLPKHAALKPRQIAVKAG